MLVVLVLLGLAVAAPMTASVDAGAAVTLHVHDFGRINYDNDPFWDWLRRARPRFLKTLDPNGRYLAKVKSISPNTVVVWRPYVPAQYEEDVGWYRSWMTNNLSYANSSIDCLEGVNEPGGQSNWDSWLRWLEVEREIIELVGQQGKCFVGLTVATGNPTLDFFVSWDGSRWVPNGATEPRLRAYFETLARYGGYWGPHEYDAPDAYSLHFYGLNKPPDARLQALSPYRQGDGGAWLALRFRRVLTIMRDVYGWPEEIVPRVMIGEALIDGGVTHPARGPQPGGGWKDFLSVGRLVEELEWYVGEASKEPKFVGVALFGYATADPTWESWNLRGFEQYLPVPTVAPAPAPMPLEARMSAEEQRNKYLTELVWRLCDDSRFASEYPDLAGHACRLAQASDPEEGARP